MLSVQTKKLTEFPTDRSSVTDLNVQVFKISKNVQVFWSNVQMRSAIIKKQTLPTVFSY